MTRSLPRTAMERDPLINLFGYASEAGASRMTKIGIDDATRFRDRFAIAEEPSFPHSPEMANQLRLDAERFGFTFGRRIDSMFVEANFPEGWKYVRDEGYGSTLRDDQGRARGTMFFKPAFYDYFASASFYPRYHFEEVRPEKYWMLSQGYEPTRLFKVVGHRWKKCSPDTYVPPGSEDDFEFFYPYYYPDDSMVGLHGLGYKSTRIPVRQRVEIRQYLPEDKQPKGIARQDYESYWEFRDRMTGRTLLTSQPFVVPHNGVVNHYKIEKQNSANAFRELQEVVSDNLPNFSSLSYWFD